MGSYSWEFIAILLAGAASGGFINGLAGFGTALFALGWWLQIMPPIQAVAIVLAMSVASGLQGAWVVRRQINARRLGVFLVPGLIGIPVGLHLLALVDAVTLKLMIGGFMLAYGVFFIVRRGLPNLAPMPVVDGVIGLAGGVLGAMAGLSGALPTMWLALRDWTKETTRAVLQPFNLAILGLSALLLAWQGAYTRETLILMAIALPATMAAAQLGIWTFKRLEDAQFRWLLVGMTFVAGAVILVREMF
ncbi:MAG: sulfite exporter TauE/SafE family protein [Pseudomonadota bacterium]